MTAAQKLWAVAAAAERAARFRPHTTWRKPGEPDDGKHHGCLACHLEAKARLYVRAGNAAEGMDPPR